MNFLNRVWTYQDIPLRANFKSDFHGGKFQSCPFNVKIGIFSPEQSR